MGGIGGFVEDVTGINLGNNSSSDRALAEQRAAAGESSRVQKEIFDIQRQDAAPWREAGRNALTGLNNDDFQRDFTMSDFQADPGYQFRMAEGMKALERSAAAKGGLNSGATMKAIARYGQDMASNEFQNAYNRFNTDRDRRFNRLSSIAGLGQTANTQIAEAGQNYANQYGANVTGAADASAAQAMGQMSQRNQLIGQGASALAFCDERLKTNIEPLSQADLAEMKSHLKAYAFNYISPEFGEGDFIGVMAQDLEKSKLGRTLVFTDGQGHKQIDLKRVMMLFLATIAEG